MKKWVNNFYIVVFCFLIFGFTYYSIISFTNKNNLKIENGYLNLSDVNLDEGPFCIEGEWEFYFNKLLYTEDFIDNIESFPKQYIRLPSNWAKYKDANNESLPSEGKATYRIKIKVNEEQEDIGIKLNNIWGKSKIIIKSKNNFLEENEFSNSIVRMKLFNVDDTEFEVLIQLENSNSLKSGILKSIYIGSEKSITNFRDKYLIIDISCVISFLMLAFYFFNRACQKNELILNLSLGVYSISAALFLSMSDEILITKIFSNLSMESISNLTMILGTISASSLIVYINEYYKIGLSKKIIKKFIFVYIIALIIIFSLNIFKKLDFGKMHASVGIIIILFATGIIIKSIINKIEGTRFNILALISMLLMILVGIYNTFNSKQINFLFPFYVIIFTISQAMLLSNNYFNSVKEIEKLSNELKILDKRKDDFLERISYELMLPLKGILNISNALIDGVAGTLTNEQEENIEMISATSNRLSILIEDILDYYKFTNGYIKNKREIVNVKSILFLVINIIEYSFKDKPIIIKNSMCPETITVSGDENRLKQVFYNLIDILLIFTDRGCLTIELKSIDNKAIISIKNKELYIEDGEAIINSMKNINWSNRIYTDKKRSDIGLWVSSTIIALHGGEIKFSSTRKLGTEFLIVLPVINNIDKNKEDSNIYLEESARSQKENINVNKGNSHSILLLEANEINNKVINNSLKKEGYIVNNIESSEKLLDLMDKGIKNDLLIINAFLPNTSGYNLLRKIRSKYDSISLPILMIVDKAYPENISLALYLEATDVLVEPYDISELRARVHTLIQLKDSVSALVDSEMAFLKAQIKPHFIFNALSVISSLITRNPIKAKELLLDFSDYLRNSFDFSTGDNLVALSKEIELTKAYVAIEKERFKSRLKINFDIEEDIKIKIPSLIIQPIVENAIRHGVLNKLEGGNINIIIYKESKTLIINIKDDGIGMQEEKVRKIMDGQDDKAGVGIKNINSRLIRTYGEGLEIKSIIGHGTEVIMKIPIG
ncbi:ATP-binding protein [Clostridium sp. 1001275B_160808_H3]|uniref:ATP-binding protein n=1 Tax=Clostridium sp. 1001275B_160808_H3 TaxID=2787110 RepID=UPI001898AA11|nr:ATP-binding protein [Clostridium sp. 1001275B_160808_H3]